MKKIAINGFGRIGRAVFRGLLKEKNLKLVGLNNTSSNKTVAHLLKYDSIYGTFKNPITYNDKHLIVNDLDVEVFHESNPANIPWDTLDVDIVIEATGCFRTRSSAHHHIEAGAKQVIISAPGDESIPMVVMGVNDHEIDLKSPILSNASCTTNCLAPIVKVLDQHFGIEKGMFNTIHAYTADQRLHDKSHKDLRRARAAAHSIIPTSTGASEAIEKIFPHLTGKITGIATRVPVINGSLVDFNVILKNKANAKAINKIFHTTAQKKMKGIVEYIEDPIVSTDVIGNLHSVVVDGLLTNSNDEFSRIIGWYDNEAAYAQRIIDLIKVIDNK